MISSGYTPSSVLAENENLFNNAVCACSCKHDATHIPDRIRLASSTVVSVAIQARTRRNVRTLSIRPCPFETAGRSTGEDLRQGKGPE